VTAAERLPEIKDATDVMGKLIMVAGLVSLAIGGIGILLDFRTITYPT